VILQTKRLSLRPITLSDTPNMVAINADPKVMEHFPAPMTQSQTQSHMQRCVKHWQDNGFGLLILTTRDTGDFIGFTGLAKPAYETPFTPCVEIGWRLAASVWGKGYAFEAANACLKWGFEELNLHEIVSFTAITNTRSTALMQRLGMRSDPADNFDHPMLAANSPLLLHVLYRLSRLT